MKTTFQAPASAPPAIPRSRLAWIDLYRGTAVLVMIETHVVNTFLSPAWRAVPWFWLLDYANGLVAPAFLFIAGLAQGLVRHRARARSRSVRPRLRRLAGIGALGFALHLPWTEIAGGRWGDAWEAGTRVDILPCLAAAMAVIVLLERFTGRAAVGLLAALTAGMLWLAPHAAEWTGGPILLRAWVNTTTGSLFPVLPWAAFAFAGYLLSGVPATLPAFTLPCMAAAGVAAVARPDYWSPVCAAFYFERLAWLLALTPLAAACAQRGRFFLAMAAGRESLVMYVVHLLLISWLTLAGAGKGSPAAVALIFVGVLSLSCAAGWAWRRWRNPPIKAPG